jgi:hypothetical protein
MRREYNLPITAITGPATDNEVGITYVQAELGLAAHNARRDADGLVGAVRNALDEWARMGENRREQDTAEPGTSVLAPSRPFSPLLAG